MQRQTYSQYSTEVEPISSQICLLAQVCLKDTVGWEMGSSTLHSSSSEDVCLGSLGRASAIHRLPPQPCLPQQMWGFFGFLFSSLQGLL